MGDEGTFFGAEGIVGKIQIKLSSALGAIVPLSGVGSSGIPEYRNSGTGARGHNLMGFDADKLDAIERIIDALALEFGRAPTTTQVRQKAQEQGITNSTGTTHRYMAEIELRRTPRSSQGTSSSPAGIELSNSVEIAAHVAMLHKAVDEFAVKSDDAFRSATTIERQNFARTLSDQLAVSRKELGEIQAVAADLRDTLEVVIAEAEQSRSDLQKATDEVVETKAELDLRALELAAKSDEKHALELRVVRLDAEVQRQRDQVTELRVAKMALSNEVQELKMERNELRATMTEMGPLREALARLEGYAEGRTRGGNQLLEETTRPKISLEKK
jgi:myosin heavy subunit